MAKTSAKIEANAFSVLGDALESAAETFEEATANAQTSAKKAASTAKRVLAQGTHKTAYYVAYGVIYSSVFLYELWPEDNPWRKGLEEGYEAAITDRRKAKEAVKTVKATVTKVKEKTKGAVKTKTKPAKEVVARAEKFDEAFA